MSGPTVESTNEIPTTTTLGEESNFTNTHVESEPAHDNAVPAHPTQEAEDAPTMTDTSDNKETAPNNVLPKKEEQEVSIADEGKTYIPSHNVVEDDTHSSSLAAVIPEQENDKAVQPELVDASATESPQPAAAPLAGITDAKELPTVDETAPSKTEDTEVADSETVPPVPLAETREELPVSTTADVEAETLSLASKSGQSEAAAEVEPIVKTPEVVAADLPTTEDAVVSTEEPETEKEVANPVELSIKPEVEEKGTLPLEEPELEEKPAPLEETEVERKVTHSLESLTAPEPEHAQEEEPVIADEVPASEDANKVTASVVEDEQHVEVPSHHKEPASVKEAVEDAPIQPEATEKDEAPTVIDAVTPAEEQPAASAEEPQEQADLEEEKPSTPEAPEPEAMPKEKETEASIQVKEETSEQVINEVQPATIEPTPSADTAQEAPAPKESATVAPEPSVEEDTASITEETSVETAPVVESSPVVEQPSFIEQPSFPMAEEPSSTVLEESSAPVVEQPPAPEVEEPFAPTVKEDDTSIVQELVETTPEPASEDVTATVADELPSQPVEEPNVAAVVPESEALVDEDAIASAIAESAEQIGLESEALKAADAVDDATPEPSPAQPSDPVHMADASVAEQPTVADDVKVSETAEDIEIPAQADALVDETSAMNELEEVVPLDQTVVPTSPELAAAELPVTASSDEPTNSILIDAIVEAPAVLSTEPTPALQVVEHTEPEDMPSTEEDQTAQEEEVLDVKETAEIADSSMAPEETSVSDEMEEAKEMPIVGSLVDAEVTEAASVSAENESSPIPSIVVPESQDAEEPVEEQPRPKSPWTPSYSVSVQGSPAQHPVTDLSAVPSLPDLDTASVDAPVSEEADEARAEDMPATVEAPEEAFNDSLKATEVEEIPRPKSPWTPSYSVSTQGTPTQELKTEGAEPASEAIEAQTDNVHDEPPMDASDDVTPEPSIETPEEIIKESETTSLAPAQAEDIPRPKSPWTPSYSVSTQGTAAEEKDVDPVQDLSEPELAAPLADTEDRMSVEAPAGVASDAVPEIVLPATEALEQLSTNTETASPAADLERPKSPWTPSYSVSTQGTPTTEAPNAMDAPAKEIDEDSANVELPTSEESVAEVPAVEEKGLDAVTAEEPERPKSPWTASYSVSTQGSPLPPNASLPVDDIVEAPKEESPAPEAEDVSSDNVSVVVEDTDKGLAPAAETEQERPKSPWTPSYSVSVQGSPNVAPVQDTDVSEVQPLDLSASNEPVTPEHSSPIPTIAIDSEEPTEATAPAEDERPKSPWTPSYSVSVQGSPAKVEAPLPETAAEEVERPKSPWTPSYSVSRQGSPVPAETPVPAVAPEVLSMPQPEAPIINTLLNVGAEGVSRTISTSTDDTVESHPDGIFSEPVSAVETAPSEAPRSPWTPSYSVSRQGSLLFDTGKNTPAAGTQDASIEDEAPNPIVEDSVEPESIADKVKDALAFPSVSHVHEELDSPSMPRARLDSTTSSRFFPGGWFSSWKTVEGRPSLDNAEGEFVSSKADVPQTVHEQGESSNAAESAPVATTGEEKKSGRWCTIM